MPVRMLPHPSARPTRNLSVKARVADFEDLAGMRTSDGDAAARAARLGLAPRRIGDAPATGKLDATMTGAARKSRECLNPGDLATPRRASHVMAIDRDHRADPTPARLAGIAEATEPAPDPPHAPRMARRRGHGGTADDPSAEMAAREREATAATALAFAARPSASGPIPIPSRAAIPVATRAGIAA